MYQLNITDITKKRLEKKLVKDIKVFLKKNKKIFSFRKIGSFSELD